MKRLETILALTLVTAIAGPLSAQTIDPERRALLIQIIEANDCILNNRVAPPQTLAEALENNAFTRDELGALVDDITKKGDAVSDDGILRLTKESCG